MSCFKLKSLRSMDKWDMVCISKLSMLNIVFSFFIILNLIIQINTIPFLQDPTLFKHLLILSPFPLTLSRHTVLCILYYSTKHKSSIKFRRTEIRPTITKVNCFITKSKYHPIKPSQSDTVPSSKKPQTPNKLEERKLHQSK